MVLVPIKAIFLAQVLLKKMYRLGMVQNYNPALRKGSIRIKSVSSSLGLHAMTVSTKRGTRGGACLAHTKPWTKWCIPLGGRGRRGRNSQ